jgi:DNA polymerase-3 subunit epsilon
MKALFYDSETTGLPLFNEPSEDPRQPHLVQLAAMLVDLDTRKTLASLDLVIRPDGWEISEEVSKIHGITTEYARDVGVPELSALQMFLELWHPDRVRIGHNETFDARIIRIAQHRWGDCHQPHSMDLWKAGKAECTQRLATPILKLPPTEKMQAVGRFHFKSANLREAYLHFTGNELLDAHSAIADVRACQAVYFAIKDRAA